MLKSIAPDDIDLSDGSPDALAPEILPEIINRRLTLLTIPGNCLNVACFRGFAPAKVLSSISQPDVYFQYTNPEGTQRDLSVEKAKRAYAYMAVGSKKSRRDLRFFTEVVLNVRNPDVVDVKRFKNGTARISIFLDNLTDNSEDPDISRVEGNHRLAYARGNKSRRALSVQISFCLIIGMSKLMEAKLFRDINSNQKPMNTSHLDSIELQLHGHGAENASEFTIIADRLSADIKSPFMDLVYRGGRKGIGTHFAVSLRTLANLSKLFISQSERLAALNLDDRYFVIRSFWKSVAAVFPLEWNDGKREFLLMKSAGLSALAMLGGRLFDDLTLLRQFDKMTEHISMLKPYINWSSAGPLQGLNGLGGANIIYRKHLLPHSSIAQGELHATLQRQLEEIRR